jgi:hypothetical protein
MLEDLHFIFHNQTKLPAARAGVNEQIKRTNVYSTQRKIIFKLPPVCS